MSLLDSLIDAKGDSAANYITGSGRTVGRIRRVSYREPSREKAQPSFRLDIEILKSSIPHHDGQRGMTGTMNLSFRFAEQDQARMRRALAAAASSAEGVQVSETDAAKRAREFVGERQPLVGAVVTIVSLTKPQTQNPSKDFTRFEVETPSEADLDGLDI